MRRPRIMKLRMFLTLAAALAGVLVLGRHFAARDSGSHPPSETLPPHQPHIEAPGWRREIPQSSPPPPAELPETEVKGAPPLAVMFGAPAWEARLNAAIDREPDAVLRAKALLALLPQMPEEALAEVAEKAVNDLPDRAYAEIALPTITNHATPAQALSVLFSDLMERPDAIALPALLTIARDAQHPFAPSALDNLRLLLRVDRGTDWAAWQHDVARRLAEER